MTQSLYKLATKEVHTYETEGVFYFYQVCDEGEVDEFVKAGWLTEFGQLKGLANDEVKEQGEEASKKTNEEVLVVKRGRKPKVKNVVD